MARSLFAMPVSYNSTCVHLKSLLNIISNLARFHLLYKTNTIFLIDSFLKILAYPSKTFYILNKNLFIHLYSFPVVNVYNFTEAHQRDFYRNEEDQKDLWISIYLSSECVCSSVADPYYCISRNSWPILCCNILYELGQDFLDIPDPTW